MQFYQRRIARIFPASILVIIAALVAAKYLYSAQDYAIAGATALSSALSLANIKLMLAGSYFEVLPDAQPLLHFWSLSVEEQFYMFFPFGIISYLKLKVRFPKLPSLLLVVSVLGVLSLISCVITTHIRPNYAFYLLPTRAWELIAGCLLAIYQSTPGKRNSSKFISLFTHHKWNGIIGLGLILVSFILVREGNDFPGIIAVLPVLGTVICIGIQRRHGLSEVILSHPVAVFIGRISYSLYLWHWPIFCFTDYALFTESPLTRTLVKVGLTAFLSILSFYAYENPLRIFLNRPTSRKKAYSVFVVAVLVVVVLGWNIRKENYLNASASSVESGGVEINYDTYSSVRHLVLIGDSRGSMYGKMIALIGESMNLNINILSVAAGDPYPGNSLYRDTLIYLEKVRPEIVVMSAAWTAGHEKAHRSLPQIVQEITKYANHLILIADVPLLPKEFNRGSIRAGGNPMVDESDKIRLQREEMTSFLKSFSAPNIHILDPSDLFLEEGKFIHFTDEMGHQLWHDAGHLSHYGSRLVQPRLEKVLEPIIDHK